MNGRALRGAAPVIKPKKTCKNCGYKVDIETEICPYCQKNPDVHVKIRGTSAVEHDVNSSIKRPGGFSVPSDMD